MSTKTESRKLMCQLSEEELLQRGNELAKTYMEIAALDLQKKRINAQIKPLDERIEALVVIIDTKEEERSVACEWQPDFTLGIKRLVRLDSYDVIDTRDIKDWERQQELDLQSGKSTLTDVVDVCPKCDGDGEYYEDGIEGGGGEIYCDCPAGVALQEQKQAGSGRCTETCDQRNDDTNNGCDTWEDIRGCAVHQGKAEPKEERPRKIYLADSFFAKDGRLTKAFKGMAGVPEDGKAKNVFQQDFLYLIHGSMSSGAEGNMKFYAYKMLGRGAYDGPVETVKECVARFHADRERRCALSHVGCLVTFEHNEWVLAESVVFCREKDREQPKPVAPKTPHICDYCRSAHPSCTDCCDTCTKHCNALQGCRMAEMREQYEATAEPRIPIEDFIEEYKVKAGLAPSADCTACHAESGCEQCCATCGTKCHNEMYCRVEEAREMSKDQEGINEASEAQAATEVAKTEPVSATATAGDLAAEQVVISHARPAKVSAATSPPGTQVSECAGFCGELSEDQVAWRNSVCADDWRECKYADKCFGPANEEGDEASCTCLKEDEQKKQKALTSETACKVCGFDAKSKTYLTRHIRDAHNLTIAKYNKHFPPPKPDLDKLREERAKRLLRAEPEKDGITPDRIETLQVELGNGNLGHYRMQIHVSCGDSGNWYNAIHLHTPNGGTTSYYPYPNRSERYPDRAKAIKAACDLVYNEAQKLITDEKLLRLVAVAISDFAVAQNLGAE